MAVSMGSRACRGRALSSRSTRAVRRVAPAPRAQAAAAAAAGSGAGGLSKADPSSWITALVTPNSPVVRVAALGALAAVARYSTPLLGAHAAAALHVGAAGILLGNIVYTTFFAGISLFKGLPRQTFRDVQEILFPKYFALCTAMSAFLVVSGLCSFVTTQAQMASLGMTLAASLLNLLVLEPKTSTVMRERAALERAEVSEVPDKKEKLAACAKSFGMLHGMSSLLNLGMLVGAVSHTWWIASKVVV